MVSYVRSRAESLGYEAKVGYPDPVGTLRGTGAYPDPEYPNGWIVDLGRNGKFHSFPTDFACPPASILQISKK